MSMFDGMLNEIAKMIERATKVDASVRQAGTDASAIQKISDDLNLGDEVTQADPDELSATPEQAEALHASAVERETKDLRDKLAKYIFKG